jgi:PAS domain S-box-containing protein
MQDPLHDATSNDAFFRAIIDSSNDAIISKDLEGIITSWNKGAECLFGYRAAEVIGKPVTILFPRSRFDEEPSILRSVRAGKIIDHYRTVRQRKDGSLVDVSLSVSPIKNESGVVMGAATIIRDITEQERDQERFRVTLSSIGDAVISTDVQGRITFMNSVAESLTGWHVADAAGKPHESIFRIVSEINRHPVDSPVMLALRDGKVVGLANHTVLIARDDTERAIDDSAAPIRDSSGNLLGAVLVFRDVSHRREAELAFLRLAAIVTGSDDAIISKNLNGIVTSWNPAAERIFGYAADEMLGQSITRVIPPDRLEEEQQILSRLQRGDRVDHFETIRMRKDGRRIHVSLSISPIRDKEGIIIGASKIARDITDIKLAQQTLAAHAADLELKVNERTAALQETVSELEAFSYSLSHDLRAPLRAIQSYTEMVVEDYGDSLAPEALGHLRKVIKSSSRMDRLIRDVLNFARIARTDIAVAPVDVNELVRDLIRERPELHEPGVAITIDSPLYEVIGHDASLTQCLANLLDNAVKFVARGQRPKVRVFSTRSGGLVRVCVQDNGIGIDAEGQKRLFGIFERLHSHEVYSGTGVGLAIVRRAAERMHGKAGVQSAPGLGSTFWIELPEA